MCGVDLFPKSRGRLLLEADTVLRKNESIMVIVNLWHYHMVWVGCRDGNYTWCELDIGMGATKWCELDVGMGTTTWCELDGRGGTISWCELDVGMGKGWTDGGVSMEISSWI